MNAVMRRLQPGGFVWLVAHELRLAMRAARRRRSSAAIWTLLLVLYALLGIWIGNAVSGLPIPASPFALTLILAACALVMSFMTTQAMLRSQETLYASGDLDLLLSAPLEPNKVLLAKLCGIAASIVLTFAFFLLPIAIPVAAQGHPGLFGIPVVLAALALVSACLGLAITLAVVSLAGPRTARTLAQIIGALLGAGLFLLSQFLSQDNNGRQSAGEALFTWLASHNFGASGVGALPGRAALGDPLALLVLLGAAIFIFAAAGASFGRLFLASYQNAGMRLSRRRAAPRGKIARHFRAGLFAAMFAKEWRLLVRDPQLAFAIVLRIIYLAPIALPAFTHGRGPPFLPALAFASVLIAGQLAGSLAWLTVSGEDSPDLLAVAPVSRAEVGRAKLASALAMAAPFGLILPAAIALASPLAALVTLVMTAAGGFAAAFIELKTQKPAPRKSFGRRRSGSFLVGLLTFLMTAILGAAAALIVYLLG